jgi:hypothetical protein
MKLYLDDARIEPEGWARAYTYEECLELLTTGLVTHLDLDWHLGQGPERTGLAVLEWLEREVRAGRVPLPRLSVHTSDPGARQRMLEIVARLTSRPPS